MDDDLPSLSPAGTLIRRARLLMTPKMSIRAAASRAGISPETWGIAERGYRDMKGGRRPVSTPPETIAKMARVVQVSPRDLEADGQDPAAASELRTLMGMPRNDAAAAGPADHRGGTGEGALAPFLAAVQAALIDAITRTGSTDPPGAEIPGLSDWERGWWDRQREDFPPGGPLLSPSERVRHIARLRLEDEEGRRAGLPGKTGALKSRNRYEVLVLPVFIPRG